MKGIIKRIMLKATSVKTIGFAIATILLLLGKISSQTWLVAYGIFAGANVGQKYLFKNNNKDK